MSSAVTAVGLVDALLFEFHVTLEGSLEQGHIRQMGHYVADPAGVESGRELLWELVIGSRTSTNGDDNSNTDHGSFRVVRRDPYFG